MKLLAPNDENDAQIAYDAHGAGSEISRAVRVLASLGSGRRHTKAHASIHQRYTDGFEHKLSA